jgi:hypothetical protein
MRSGPPTAAVSSVIKVHLPVAAKKYKNKYQSYVFTKNDNDIGKFLVSKNFKIEILTENLEHYNNDEKQIYFAASKTLKNKQ